MNKRSRQWQRLLALAIGSMLFAVFAPTVVQAALPDVYPVDERGLGQNAAKPSNHRAPIK
jgi:hypothetical protein